jgi:hypothetical protein
MRSVKTSYAACRCSGAVPSRHPRYFVLLHDLHSISEVEFPCVFRGSLADGDGTLRTNVMLLRMTTARCI